MKAPKLTELQTWDLKAISHAYGMSKENLRYRCQKLNIHPINYKGKYEYRLNSIDIDRILAMVQRKTDTLPSIIYVTRTTEILHSKLNFLTLEQL
jgi:hypothetical protein